MPKRSARKSNRARRSSSEPSGSVVSEHRDNLHTIPAGRASDDISGSPPKPADSPGWFAPSMVVVVVIGFVLRLWHILQTATLPTVAQPMGDARGYLNWANQLAQGDWYGTETFYQAPLYPYFLGVLIVLGGPSLTWIRVCQAVLGALNAAFLGGAARRLFDAPTGIVAAVMTALYGPAIYYDGIIQKASLSMFLLSLLIYLLAIMSSHDTRSTMLCVLLSIAIGSALSMLCLTRENALLWIVIIPPWAWWIHKSINRLDRAKVIGGFALGLAIVLVPVAARNASLGGEWSPTTFQSGPNFYIGNGLQATGVYQPLVPGHESPEFERADAQALAESFTGRPLTAREVSRFWTTRAIMEIMEQPGRWMMLMVRKSLMTVNHYEVPDTESPYVHQFWSTPLRWLLRSWGFGMLLPVAMVGIYAASTRFKRAWLFPTMAVSMGFAVAAFFILGRYRLPLAPLLIPFAALAVTHATQEFVTRRQRILATSLLVGGLILAFLPVHDVRGLTASAYMNTGIAYGRAGDAAQSRRWIGDSIAIRGETAMGLYNLAGAQLLSGQQAAAIESLQKARELNPTFIEVELQLGKLHQQRRDLNQAEYHYRRAQQIDPGNAEAAARIRSLQGPLHPRENTAHSAEGAR